MDTSIDNNFNRQLFSYFKSLAPAMKEIDELEKAAQTDDSCREKLGKRKSFLTPYIRHVPLQCRSCEALLYISAAYFSEKADNLKQAVTKWDQSGSSRNLMQDIEYVPFESSSQIQDISTTMTWL